jgi:ubiquinone/menaquinone biosynthesis C-methylase UbiE
MPAGRLGAAATVSSDGVGGRLCFVPESRFGLWFLNTHTWSERVLKVAIADLRRLVGMPSAGAPVLLDVGCGHGLSLPQLMAAFQPRHLIGLDPASEVLATARRRATALGPRVSLLRGDCTRLPLADASVDLIFCHQTFHHLIDQPAGAREFHRVLRPGGLLLFAESTRAYIESWIIRWLFSHPAPQHSAAEYLAILREAGFHITPDRMSFPYLWWSRSDLGLAERWFRVAPPRPGQREETLLNLVAVRAA